MAKDVITRFKLETTQFDSKLRDSAKGLKSLTEQLSFAGNDFDRFAQKHVEAARALGNVQSGATNLKDKLKDLVGAYNDVAKAYETLTNEQKQSDFGKAMAESLTKLQGQIKQTKDELYNVGEGAKGTGGIMEQFAQKLTVNIDALKLFQIGLKAANVALDVAKDAFFATESGIDEWGRSLEGANGAYNVFLDTLNNGNWSGFFQNLTTAIQGARDLYDSLDRLGSVKSNNEAAIAITQRAIAQLRKRKQGGEDVDDQIMQQSNKLAALQNQAVVQGEKAGRDTMYQTIRNSINSIGGAKVGDASINAAIEGLLNEGQPQFDKYAQTVKKFENWSKAQRTVTKSDMDGNTWQTQQFDINLLTKEQQRQYKIAKAITDKETEIQKGINIFAQAVNEGTSNSREQFKNTRYALQGSGGSGGSSVKGSKGGVLLSNEEMASIVELVFPKGTTESMNDLKNELARFTTMQATATTVEEYNTATQGIKDTKERMDVQEDALRMGVSTDTMLEISKAFADSVQENMEKAFEGFDLSSIKPQESKQEKDAAKEMKNVASTVQGIAGGVSNIFSGVETLGVTIPNEIKGVISTVQGIATILSGIASVVTIIAALSAKPFARGGIVGHAAGGLLIGGNSYSGDNLRLPVVGGGQIAVNSGELILNQAQQNHLANALSQPLVSGGGGSAQPYVTGEQIFLGLNNYLRANGYGEIVTSR